MAELNTEWALEKLRGFLRVLELRYVPDGPNTFGFAHYALANPKEEVQAAAQVAEQILDRIVLDWRTADWIAPAKQAWWRHREATHRAIAQLEAQEELEANLGSVGPKLSAASLHPWVWGSIAGLWGSGHFGEAVGAAARAINAQAQSKLGRRDASEWALLSDAFSPNRPIEGHPRLRLSEDDGGDTFRNQHAGAGDLARGLYRAVRNPLSHEETEIAENVALEYVAAFSVLARWVDAAEVLPADN
ncbi:Protein of unknown function (Hypoth_ymh) [Microlunatus sagamiharensis]|uniref:Conserved hypothetical protein CHP02391 domain-containing protein n=1 Tax=Microlunatus sagamiharensis TaxID=546874 RepID=A0A1H2MLZ4_9ACTN|nr:TIGR02391 family protein [Microlunatus sagamiharensis]SDU93951.1 Protein of unknown function (Hypoth_ymh) [Microlunatus sagamiharensis]